MPSQGTPSKQRKLLPPNEAPQSSDEQTSSECHASGEGTEGEGRNRVHSTSSRSDSVDPTSGRVSGNPTAHPSLPPRPVLSSSSSSSEDSDNGPLPVMRFRREQSAKVHPMPMPPETSKQQVVAATCQQEHIRQVAAEIVVTERGVFVRHDPTDQQATAEVEPLTPEQQEAREKAKKVADEKARRAAALRADTIARRDAAYQAAVEEQEQANARRAARGTGPSTSQRSPAHQAAVERRPQPAQLVSPAHRAAEEVRRQEAVEAEQRSPEPRVAEEEMREEAVEPEQSSPAAEEVEREDAVEEPQNPERARIAEIQRRVVEQRDAALRAAVQEALQGQVNRQREDRNLIRLDNFGGDLADNIVHDGVVIAAVALAGNANASSTDEGFQSQ